MTTKANILKAIRKNCLQCSCGSEKEIKLCTFTNCPLYPYRMGKDLNPSRTSKNLSSRGAKNANDEKLQGYQELTDNGDFVTKAGGRVAT
jgi:hypothetical protein